MLLVQSQLALLLLKCWWSVWLPVQGSARTQEGATPAPTNRATAGEGEKVEGQGVKGEGDADAEEAAALLHHFANGRL